MKKVLSKILAWKKTIFILFVLAILFYNSQQPVNLRSEKSIEQGIDPKMTEKGKEILKKMAAFHGDSAYVQRKTHVVRFRNHWETLPGLVYRPWKMNNQEVEMTCQVGSAFTTEAVMKDGPNKGAIWGITKRHAYTKAHKNTTATYAANTDTELWLSTFQFLFELPFRTTDIPFIQYEGREKINGIYYHRIFATWFAMEPSNEYDQVIFYVNPSNYRLDMCHYTARESGWGFFSATIKWSDFERRAGVLEPQTSWVSFGGPNTKLFGSDIKLHDIHLMKK